MIRIGGLAATIDTPLEHLSACHRRIEDWLTTLRRAADHWGESPGEALEAIRKSLKFLDSNRALPTMDEETSLFQRLLPRVAPGVLGLFHLRGEKSPASLSVWVPDADGATTAEEEREIAVVRE